MTEKTEVILGEVLSMNPEDRAMIAHCLISSLEQAAADNTDGEWLKLAETRLAELENKKVTPVSWNEVKQKVRGL
jgi:hypothetical protein